METAGRAVVFSGITVAIGLLALIALPLPFLRSMGYGGMLIPLVSTLVAITLLPVVLAKLGPPARLAPPAHRRQGHAAPGRAGPRRSRGAAGSPPAPGWRCVGALVFAATDLQLGASDAEHARQVRRRQGRARRARGRRASARARCSRTRSWSRATPTRARWPPSLRGVEGIHGAVAPDDADWRRAAPRSSRRSRSPTAARPRARRRSTAVRDDGRTPPAPTSASAASRRPTPTSSTPSTAASR